MEHILGAEDTGVFSIKAEHQADTEFIESLLRFRIFWVAVLREYLVVEYTDDFACLDGNLQLFLQMDIGVINQEGQACIFFLQVG